MIGKETVLGRDVGGDRDRGAASSRVTGRRWWEEVASELSET